MKVVDKRVRYTLIPAREILAEIIPLFREENFTGIRQIVLLDECYHGTQGVSGLYLPVKNTTFADIEIYFEFISSAPEKVTKSKLYQTYMITKILMHEVYHHIVRGQHRVKKTSDRKEEIDADRWAEGAVGHVFREIFPEEKYKTEWEEVKKSLPREGDI